MIEHTLQDLQYNEDNNTIPDNVFEICWVLGEYNIKTEFKISRKCYTGTFISNDRSA